MRVLLINQSFYPDVVAVAQHAADLATELTAQGHSVTVVASSRAYSNPMTRFAARETWRGCEVHRLPSLGLGKKTKFRRVLDSAFLLSGFLWELIRLPAYDVVVAMTHPPMVAFLAALISRFKGGRLVSWVMDLNPDEAIAAGWLHADSITVRLLNRILSYTLRTSRRIIVPDRFVQRRIEKKGVPPEKVLVVAPWSHDEAVRYDDAGRAQFRKTHGLSDKFVVMYSGNLSLVHPLDTLLAAAAELRNRAEIVFCFVGDGNALFQVRAFAAQSALTNVVCLPYQPLKDLGASLSAADLHAVVMGNAMVGIVHPCKIYNVLALGIPLLHIGPQQNHINDILAALRPPAAYSLTQGDVAGTVNAISDAAARRIGTVPDLVAAAAPFSQRSLLSVMLRAVEAAASAPEMASHRPGYHPLTGVDELDTITTRPK